MRCLLILAGLLLLSACTRGPSCAVIPHGRSLRWDAIFEAQVVKVWDGLHASRDPKVTHLIEVEVREGPEGVGQRLAFPYDEWSCGKPPPQAGEIVVFSPRQWVAVDPRSMGRPRDGF